MKTSFDSVRFIEEAWSHSTDTARTEKFYSAAAKRSPDVALALSRWNGVGHAERDLESLEALEATSHELIAPLATAQVRGPHAQSAASALGRFGTSRSAPVLRELLKTAAGSLVGPLASALALHGEVDDFAAISKARGLKEFSRAMATLAVRGFAPARQRLAKLAEEWVTHWRDGNAENWEVTREFVDALGRAQIDEAVPSLLHMAESPCVVEAFQALEAFNDARAVEVAHAVIEQSQGDLERAPIYRLAAGAFLMTKGHEQPLDDAYVVLERACPHEYGWPKLENLYQLQALAVRVLVLSKKREALEVAARWATSPSRAVRAQAFVARRELGLHAEPTWCDQPHVTAVLASKNTKQAMRWLTSDTAVFAHNAARALALSKDTAAQKAAVTWALSFTASRHNFATDDSYEGHFGPELSASMTVLAKLKSKPAVSKLIAASKSEWVRTLVLGEKVEFKEAFEAPRSVVSCTTRRFDDAPFVFGAQINGLARDGSGTRLAVICGDAPAAIVDAATGERLTTLAEQYRWGFDASFSPDGATVVVAYHGGHLVQFDSQSGKILREFKGFGGVPRAARKVSFAPDGKLIAATGSDGSARLFDAKSGRQVWKIEKKGAFEAVRFIAGGNTVLFSRVTGANEVYIVDVKTKKTKVVKTPASVWDFLEDSAGNIWAGGEGKVIQLYRPDFKPVPGQTLKQAGVTRLAFAADGSLLAASQSGELHRWNLAKKKSEQLKTGKQLWALTTTANGFATAGSDGVVTCFDGTGAPQGKGGRTHTQQLRGLVCLANQDLLSVGWEGLLLRWPQGSSRGTVLYEHGSRLTALAISSDQSRVFVGADSALIAVDLAGGKPVVKKLKSRVEDLAVQQGRLAVACTNGAVTMLDQASLAEQWGAKAGSEANALAFTSDGGVLVGTAHGELYAFDAQGKQTWFRREHGLDLVDKDPMGNPHRNVVGLDVANGQFATLSNDDTLRVFDVKTKTRHLRALVEGGLFNSCSFSPDGRRLAATGSGLVVYDVQSRREIASVPAATLRATTVVGWRTNSSLVVGLEEGAIYEVTLND